jgi:UDP-2-acetamido-3-amino-2,3-dideoxy-glucuronate N-acetyltransferase
MRISDAEKAYFVHESSYVDDDAEVGDGTKIWHFCHIMSGAKIGKNCSLGQNVKIGSRAFIERKAEYRKTVVKKGASIGANATMLCGVTHWRIRFNWGRERSNT